MSWSVRLFDIAGTTLRLHLTFFLLLIWVAAASWPQGGAPAALSGIVLVLLVFVCVILHEFGHIFAARRYGIRTPDITILPIGGLARLEKMPDKPGQELIVAIAGPLVNVVIAAALFGILGARIDFTDMAEIEQARGSILVQLAAINVVIVVFNLIPAFPLDGGRMLRALLAYRFDRATATFYAARVGQTFAVALAVFGLFYNPFLALIAIFILFAAESESRFETQRASLSGRSARDAMVERYESLAPDDTAERAGQLLLQTTQQEFPVLDRSGNVAGMVTRSGLIQAIAAGGVETQVKDFMETEVQSVEPDAPLEDVMNKIYNSPVRAVLIVGSGGGLSGYVSAENATELFMLDSARGRTAA
ncbi:MAG: site-2 protease family protein [Paracoccaceae bacterium]